MTKAIWAGIVLAESDQTIIVEGNHYFPPDSVNREHLEKSNTRTICPWKGEANYYNLVVDEKTHEDAAWYYPEAKKEAEHIQDYVAFWRGVEIQS